MSLWDAGRPRFAEDAGYSNISYTIGRRIYDAGIYPFQAPNGSSILVHAHERGLSFAWRGGRPLRHKLSRAGAEQTRRRDNRQAQDEDVDMDGEEDEERSSPVPPQNSSNDHNDGEEEQEEDEDLTDLSTPHSRIRRSLDLPLGSPPLHVAFAPLSAATRAYDDLDIGVRDDPDFPSLFHQDVVVAVTCQDSSIHVIAVPLEATQETSTSDGKPDYKDIIVSVPRPGSSLRMVPNNVSLSWTSELKDRRKNDSRETRSGQARSAPASGSRWTLLVATTSNEAGGMLKIHAVPVVCKADSTDIDAEASMIFRSEHLPVQPCKVSFKPTPFPSKHHSHLFVADMGGSIRLYDAMSRSRSLFEADARRLSHARGRWLTTLHSPLESSSAVLGRSRIIDVAWAMSGACVVVLLASGHWGVWDIDGAGPSASGGLLRGMSSGSSISGAAVTPVALKGFIGSVTNTKGEKASRESDGQSEQVTQLAPMTPNTRKSKQGRLFNQDARSGANAPTGSVAQGGISIASVANQNREGRTDNALVIWFNGEVYSIPSLHSYWHRAMGTSSRAINGRTGSGTEETLFGSGLSPIPMMPPQGELITSISQFPLASSASSTVPGTLRTEIMVSTESRIAFVQPYGAETSIAERNLTQLFRQGQTSSGTTARPASSHLDQALLSRGQLDLGGMDRMLSNMNGTTADQDTFAMSGALQPAGRRVGFTANA